ncbi:MAG TPA: methyltransferase domain-containing protein [Phototrophicaceae bacterium]|nr:methyltransferase domain-containing protein [Phototrophicaceae bacterium]
MTSIFALTTRGLEAISAAEIAAVVGVAVQATTYRRVTAECAASLAPLLDLRTVDDVYLDLATWTGIGHTRDVLAVLQWHATQLDLASAAEQIKALRPLAERPVFSVTASFVGKRNFSSDEIKQTVKEGVREISAWNYSPDDREADLNLRVFIEHENAYVGLRLSKSPLHERAYKQVERAGSLKPSVAAAMLRLADFQPNQTLLDPCCGSGTILIEAVLTGTQARGGDSDDEAVEAARLNAQAAQVEIALAHWDARQLPLANGSSERIVTNLPWGRQVAVDDELARFYRAVCAEIERVLAPGGKAVVLTSAPSLLAFERLRPVEQIEISLFGQTPTISVLV